MPRQAGRTGSELQEKPHVKNIPTEQRLAGLLLHTVARQFSPGCPSVAQQEAERPTMATPPLLPAAGMAKAA